jgi:hypothetical protein
MEKRPGALQCTNPFLADAGSSEAVSRPRQRLISSRDAKARFGSNTHNLPFQIMKLERVSRCIRVGEFEPRNHQLLIETAG